MKKIVFKYAPKELPSKDSLLSWLTLCAKYYKVELSEVMYNFVSKEEMLVLNQKHLNHDTHTDIITFSYTSFPVISAEIYISTEQCRENASLNHTTTENELLRLISHGFLHAVGYNDKTEAEKHQMTAEENRCIDMFHVKHQTHV